MPTTGDGDYVHWAGTVYSRTDEIEAIDSTAQPRTSAQQRMYAHSQTWRPWQISIRKEVDKSSGDCKSIHTWSWTRPWSIVKRNYYWWYLSPNIPRCSFNNRVTLHEFLRVAIVFMVDAKLALENDSEYSVEDESCSAITLSLDLLTHLC